MEGQAYTHKININNRNLSVAVFALFFAWLLAFPFEGQILYSLADLHQVNPDHFIFGAIAVHFAGLFLCGFFINNMRNAKLLMLVAIAFSILASVVFFFQPSILWTIAIIIGSFLAGGSVAAWGFYFKEFTPKNERIKTAADALIYSNILMIILNMVAIHLSPHIGLGLAIIVLGAALRYGLQLPDKGNNDMISASVKTEDLVSVIKPLAFLCFFVVVITINSGLMYQVLNPAYAHLEWLTSWYWAIPYIVALYIMRNLPRKTNRTYILYLAIAMIGFSFLSFMILDRSAPSYLVVNTLMLGACGVYDLFWWSILGEMLDFDKNPAKVLGIGLSANVLGVLLGGLIGNTITSVDMGGINPTVLALAVVCVTLVILPPLHKHLTGLLKDHIYLTAIFEMSHEEHKKAIGSVIDSAQLTEREREIAALLLTGKTYRMIAGEIHVSENTVKTHVKNIYSKLKIQSRTELFNIMFEQQFSVRQ